MVRVATVMGGLAGIVFAYYVLVASSLPDSLALWVNLIAVPTLVGAIAYFGFLSTPKATVWLLVAPVLLPFAPMAYLGGDPAKPGLQWLVYYVLVAFLAVGEATAWLAWWFTKRYKDARHVQA